MLIEHYDLEVFTPHCQPGSECLSAIARLVVDIAPVMPYLNATLEDAAYNPNAPALTCRVDGRFITFCAYHIGIEYVEDRSDAQRVAEELVALVNRTWEHSDSIIPNHTAYRRPRPMDIYKLLPQTNCKACGQPTCFTFALKMVTGEVQLSDCPALQDPAHVERLGELRALTG
jgi:ArsR family metal-binding transcriptional regulator